MSKSVRSHSASKRRLPFPFLLKTILVTTLTSVTALAGTYHVSDAAGDDGNDGLSWENPIKTISAAVGMTVNGDTILVTNGTYTITEQITLDKAITLASVNGREVTDIVGNNTFRLLYINHPLAIVSGFTLSKGRSEAGSLGGGVAIDTLGGTLQDCRITDCTSKVSASGTAVNQAAGLILRCIIDQNTYTRTTFATVYLSGGEIVNSLIVNNKVHNNGGGLYMVGGTARNCTIAKNEASGKGSGVYRSGTAKLENCIIWGNVNRLDPTGDTRNLFGGTVDTVVNCNIPFDIGTDTLTNEPAFADFGNDDYRLRAASPCIDAGLTSVNSETVDVDGGTRVSGTDIDIGAYEFDTSLFSCGFIPTVAHGLAPLETTLVPAVYGTATDFNLLETVWTLSNGQAADVVISNTGLQSVTRTLDAGLYTVTFEVTDPVTEMTVTTVVPNAIRVSPETLYVVTENTNADAPYATWETAATNLHDALTMASDGSTIIVSNGTYSIAQQLVFDRAVTMQSVNGYASTIIQAPKTRDIRVLTLSHADARVEGFTLRDGRGGNGNPGGGVLIGAAGGTLFNCRVTDNESNSYDGHGGGVCMYAGRVSNCIIDNNKITLDSMKGCGINLEGGIVENCLILTNKTHSTTQNTGGGVYLNNAGIVRNCTIIGNTAKAGGGIAMGTRNGSIQNCIIVDNITGNDTSPGAPNWYNQQATASAYENVCTPVAVGANTITAGPEFVDAEAHNYQLRIASPCVDAGKLLEGLPETDLAGNPRISGTGIDIGAYEYDTRILSCGIAVSPAKAVTAAEITLTASYFGFSSDTNDLHFAWVLDDEAGTPVQSGLGLSAIQHTYDALGHYHVRLTVSEPSSEKSVSTVLSNAVHIAPATLYIVQENTSPMAPYDSWSKAATNVYDVLGEAIDGCTILISNGTYHIPQTILLDKGVVLRGINGWEVTTLQGAKVEGVRILNIDHPNAIVEGLTIRGGKTAYIGLGGGVNITDGTLRGCLITDNAVAGYSTGAGINQLGGLVSGCIISNNAVAETGGGVSITGGITENSLITASRAGMGGGVNMTGGILRNCTITGNAATSSNSTRGHGGGVARQDGSIINCIIWDNTAINEAYEGYPDWSGAHATAYSNNCTSVEVGANCLVADPLFKNPTMQNYRIASNSPCRDQGLYQSWMAGATDLWGNSRVDDKMRVDIGAHEVPFPSPSVISVR